MSLSLIYILRKIKGSLFLSLFLKPINKSIFNECCYSFPLQYFYPLFTMIWVFQSRSVLTNGKILLSLKSREKKSTSYYQCIFVHFGDDDLLWEILCWLMGAIIRNQ